MHYNLYILLFFSYLHCNLCIKNIGREDYKVLATCLSLGGLSNCRQDGADCNVPTYKRERLNLRQPIWWRFFIDIHWSKNWTDCIWILTTKILNCIQFYSIPFLVKLFLNWKQILKSASKHFSRRQTSKSTLLYTILTFVHGFVRIE